MVSCVAVRVPSGKDEMVADTGLELIEDNLPIMREM
jgi:hypothetical protein